MDKINKRTKELLSNNKEEGYSDIQALQNQITSINSERAKNAELLRQQGNANEKVNNVARSAGEIVAEDNSTDGVLSKYGMPRTTKNSSTKTVKTTPSTINITNNNITTTTQQVASSGNSSGGGTKSKFKQWMENLTNQQRNDEIKRERAFDHRDRSLSNQVRRLTRKMESAGKAVLDKMKPERVASSPQNQLKTLMAIFGAEYLADNFKRVLAVGDKLVGLVKGALDWFGVTKEGMAKGRMGKEGTFRGDLFYLFSGHYPTDKNDNLGNLFGEFFKTLREDIEKWLDWQAEKRGIAVKKVKFPKLEFDSKGGGIFSGLLNGLGEVMGKTMTGVSKYLGDLITAFVNPTEGMSNSIANKVTTAGNKATEVAREKQDPFGRSNIFSEHTRSLNGKDMVTTGDKALVSDKNQKQTLNVNALNKNGELITGDGYVGAQLSQSRDILDAYNVSANTGVPQTPRIVTGVQRLAQSARMEGNAVVDGELLTQLFGSPEKAKGTKVRLKLVEANMTDSDKLLEQQYYARNFGSTGFGDAAMTVGIETAADQVPLLGGLLVKGSTEEERNRWMNHLNFRARASSILFGERLSGGAQISERGGIAKKKYILVPEDDERPSVNGRIYDDYYSVPSSSFSELATRLGSRSGKFSKNDYDTIYPAMSDLVKDSTASRIKEEELKKASGSKELYNSKLNTFNGMSTSQILNYKLSKTGHDPSLVNPVSIENELKTIKRFKDGDEQLAFYLKNSKNAQMRAGFINGVIGTANKFLKPATNFMNDSLNSMFDGKRKDENKPTPLRKSDVENISNYIITRLINEAGLTPEQAAGWVGNFRHESADFSYYGTTTYDASGLSGGIAMWHDSADGKTKNLTNLMEYAKSYGKDWRDIPTQVDFLIHGVESSAKAELKRQSITPNMTVEDSTRGVSMNFEKWAGYKDKTPYSERVYQRRISLGESALNSYESSISQGQSTQTGDELMRGLNDYTRAYDTAKNDIKTLALVGDSWMVGLSSYFKFKSFSQVGAQIVPAGKKLVSDATGDGYNPLLLYIGINSYLASKDALVKQYDSILKDVVKGGTTVYICTYPSIDSTRVNPSIPKLNQAILESCKSSGAIPVVISDGYRGMFNKTKTDDGIHLNKKGLIKLSNEIKSKLADLTLNRRLEGPYRAGFHMLEDGITYKSSQVDEMKTNLEAYDLWSTSVSGSVINPKTNKPYKDIEEFAADYGKLGVDDRKNIQRTHIFDPNYGQLRDTYLANVDSSRVDTINPTYSIGLSKPNKTHITSKNLLEKVEELKLRNDSSKGSMDPFFSKVLESMTNLGELIAEGFTSSIKANAANRPIVNVTTPPQKKNITSSTSPKR